VLETIFQKPIVLMCAKSASPMITLPPCAPHIGNLKPKCVKCGLPHKMKNCGVKCGYYSSMGHTKDKCWKWGKDGKITSTSNNYLEVLVNDEEAILEQLNKLCDTKHDILFGVRIPRRILPMEIQDVEIVDEREIEHINSTKNLIVCSKILHHFIKGNFFLFPIEIILAILDELESLENMVKLTRKKRDEGLKTINLTKVEGSHAIQKININKNCRNKTLHLLVEINNNLIKGLVDIRASMSIMSTTIIQKLGIMHLSLARNLTRPHQVL